MRNVIQKMCEVHGVTNHAEEKVGYYRCRKCKSDAVSEWRKRAKAKLVAEFGGKCQLCGYCKCQRGLQFHHIDPTQKSFGISAYGNTRRYESMREEARKCVLLCGNCHTEVEDGVTQLKVGPEAEIV